MSMLVAFGVSALVVRVLVAATPGLLANPALGRTNVRGATVPTAGGLYALLGTLLLGGAWALVAALGGRDGDARAWLVGLGVALGFGLLGLLDDVLGDDAKGFRGHLRALRRGRLTTGGLKLAGGAAVALVAVGALAPGRLDGAQRLQLVVDAALIALGANLGNLFDRAPGRVLKVGALGAVPVAIVLSGAALGAPVAAVLGASLALLPEDLGERLMLGDTGANPLGAMLALGCVAGTGTTARWVLAGVLLVLNLASERVSFSAVIARTPPLAWLDRLGRRP